MNNPNNVGEDIDNLNEELMGKWRKGLKRIKHSSLGGNNMNYEDRIYHDGYLDGYYAGMELYHSDTEMTDEEKARRKKRRRARAVALGVGIPVGAAAAGAAIALPLALRKRKARTPKAWRKLKRVDPKIVYGVETPKRYDAKTGRPIYDRYGFDFDPVKVDEDRRIHNSWTVWDHDNKKEVELSLNEGGLWDKDAWAARKRKRVKGFRRTPGAYRGTKNYN